MGYGPFGPPIRGAPWRGLGAKSALSRVTPPVPESTGEPGIGKRRPFLQRVPKTGEGFQRRSAGASEKLHSWFNSMVRQGIIVQDGAGDWSMSGDIQGPEGPAGPTGPEGPAGGGGAITLTQDVTGTGTGTITTTLASTGVTAGAYSIPNITVDAKGRVTSIATGTGGTAGSGPAIVIKTADETVSASTALQSDDELLVPLAANSSYVIVLQLAVVGLAAGDFKVAINVPASTTGRTFAAGLVTTVAGFSADNVRVSITDLTDAGIYAFGIDPTTTTFVTMHCQLTTAGTAGNFVLRWAQFAASGTTTVKAGSFLMAFLR